MFKRILVPLDGSKRAERALPVAARIARETHGSLLLVRVVSMATELWPYVDLETAYTQAVVETELREAAHYLDSQAAVPELAGISVEIVVLHGPTAATILSVALSHGADLITICSRSYTGMTRWVMGSIADKLARHSSVPVLILRDNGLQPLTRDASSSQPLRLLAALDGSSRAMASLLPAAALLSALAAPGRGTLHLARVVKPVLAEQEDEESYSFNLRNSEQEVIEATCYLSKTVEHLRAGHLSKIVDLTWSAVIDTDVARGIVRMAECLDNLKDGGDEFDMIAISTHGHGGIQNWVTGSISQRVLNATRLPILLVRPPDMIKKQDAMMEHISVTTIAEVHTIHSH
ncbi:MAG: universal stress protein [Ktedonobacteraceae bacterium]|nr:universal stress protein [Ktedonobacteraceae bacterium]